MLKCDISTNIGGNISFAAQLNMNGETEEWRQLSDAIGGGDVPTVQTLLDGYPYLIRYRTNYVSPPCPMHIKR
jgi:hypothetical protein